jgi:hypothetical protein
MGNKVVLYTATVLGVIIVIGVASLQKMKLYMKRSS